jgi:ADP-heptose:LPS heptosyltransferase
MRRLVIRPGAIGDLILTLPAIEALAADYTEVWVASHNVPLVRFADAVYSIASTGLDRLEISGPDACAELVGRLRAFDSIVSWYGAGRPEFRELTAALGLPFDFLAPLPVPDGCHAADYYLEQVRPLALRRVDAQPRVPCSVQRRQAAVIHPFSGSPRKNWPLERFRELARRLERLLPVEWCAGPEEDLAEAKRFDDLYALACWLAGARLYAGNDSGVTHLAAAAGAPVVALFGPTSPRMWAPRGARVRVVSTAQIGQPMEGIGVDEVWQAVRSLAAELGLP